eukprot:jgi/Undpi1/3694/HiC_scaffold_16.g07064.m1
MPYLEYGPQLRPAPWLPQSLPSDDNIDSGGADNTNASFFRVAVAPEADSSSLTSSRRRHTLVPSGFESIAHPVFFRYDPFPPPPPAPAASPGTNALRRAARASATPRLGEGPPVGRGPTSTSTRIGASVSTWTEEDGGALISAALGTGLEGRSDSDAGGDGHKSGGGGGGGGARGKEGRGGSGREVDVECPICLGRFERQVTLTSCLHTFCHTWASDASKSKGINKNEGKDKGKGKGEDSPRLMFRLLGVRTVLGGGGPTSGGVEVENASDGDGGGGDEGGTGARGDGYPTMVELRAAVRTQLAVAAAVSALDEIKCRSGRRADSRGDSGATAVTTTGESKRCNDEDTIAAAAAGAAATAQTQTCARNQASPVSGGGKHSKGGSGRRHKHRTHRERQGAAASSTPNEVDWHRVSAAAEATAAGEGAGSDGSGEERHSCSRGNNAGRLRQAQLERGSDSPLGKRHREKKRKKRRRDAEEMDRVSSSRCRGERSRRQRNGKEKENGQGMSNHEQENGQRMSIYDHARGFRSSGRVSGSGCLHWEPGSMAAEDALADIEATLEREKEGLRGRTSEPTFSL